MGVTPYREIGRTMLGGRAATPPEGGPFVAPVDRWARLEAYAAGRPYGTAAELARAREADQRLPKSIRAVTAAPQRIAAWWPAHLYPRGRIPYDPDRCDPDLVAAWAQSMAWGGWDGRQLLSFGRRQTVHGVVLTLAEVGDDLSEVYPRLVHPRYLVDLTLNARQDVTAYELAIPRRREVAKGLVESYVWRRRVDKRTIREWETRGATADRRDGDATLIRELDNPWGFCPADYSEHADDTDSDEATAAVGRLDAGLGLFDEVNGIRTSGHDFIHRLNKQTTFLATEIPTEMAQALGTAPGRPAAGSEWSGYVDAMRENEVDEESTVIPTDPNARAFPLLSNLGLGDGLGWVALASREIEELYPELALGKNEGGVRELQVRAKKEQAEHELNMAAGNADRAIRKVSGMLAAMMGELLDRDLVPEASSSRYDPFRLFDLTSYGKGDLRMAMRDREVLPPTLGELAQEAAQVERLRSVWALGYAGLTTEAIYGPQREAADGVPAETDAAYAERTRPVGIREELGGTGGAATSIEAMLAGGRV